MITVSQIVASPPFQMGYVFPDIDRGKQAFAQLEAGAFSVFEDAPVHTQTLHGKPMECRQTLAFGFLGPLNIELIQPIEGDNIYSRFLETSPQGGLHHIAWKVTEMDEAVRAMVESGFAEVQTGCFGAGTRFSYFDTRVPLGHYTELVYFDAETDALFESMKSMV